MNNNIGYIYENCKPCCEMCNFMKRNYSLKEFLELLKTIKNNFDRRLS